MSRKTAVLIAALLAVGGVAGALALGGDSVGGTFGAIGRSVVDGAIGRFAYPNRSNQPAKALARNVSRVPMDAIGAAQDAALAATARARQAAEIVADPAANGASDGALASSTPIDAPSAPYESGAEPTAEAAPPAGDAATAQAAHDDAPALNADANADANAGVVAGAEAGAASENAPGEPASDEDAATQIATRRSLALEAEIDAARGADGSAPSVEAPSDEMSDEVGAEDDEWADEDGFQFDDEEDGRALREDGPVYSSFGKRDPFFALVTARDQDAKSSELVDPDRVQLVGIMWGESGICAIVEDGRGRGYVLREGDHILYGRVVSITRNSVLVHQMIHGEFKSVELHLESPVEED